MEIFICDNCDTLATVEMSGDTITVNRCKCVTIFEMGETN